jgi:hypothetical protein
MKKNTKANTVYEKLLNLAKLKLVAFLSTSEFPLEIPRSQNRNFQYTTTLANITHSKSVKHKK